MKLLLTFVVTLGISMSSYGEFMSGNKLLSLCSSDEAFNIMACYGFIMGVDDSEAVVSEWNDLAPRSCLPKNVQMEQLKLVVIKHLQSNPEYLHLGAASLVLNSISRAFPCED